MKGNPYWEKRILELLGISGKVKVRRIDVFFVKISTFCFLFCFGTWKASDVNVVKNIPEVNAMLWKVKHLVDVKPIEFPYGEPTIDDIKYTFLKECGDCIVTKEIKFDETRMLARDEFDEKPERLDGETLKNNSRLKWLSGYEC